MIRSTPSSSGLGEHDAGVDEDGRVAAGDDHHVHAELAEPAERDQLERRVSSVSHRRPVLHSVLGCQAE